MLFLGGCGGTAGQKDNIQYVQVNVTNNSVATASYDSSNALLVLDGDTSFANFWSGNIPGDNLVIDLGSVMPIAKITVFLFDPKASMNQTYGLSKDGVVWRETMQLSGGEVPCTTGFSIGPTKVSCKPGVASSSGNAADGAYQARYFRITMNKSNVVFQVYEVEILGWVASD
ncbi:MAG: hypothetical protein COA99_03760 [Moraxellaceae bacterium]|nr:MAG: hypothetical protein COA99_03760 [Moraxellaceae bacterium]